MEEPKEIPTIYIGETDIHTWLHGDGKPILMPELLVGCEELLYNDLDEVRCARVEVLVRKVHKAFDFSVKKEDIDDTLAKILDWALYEEEYEMCQRVKELQKIINEREYRF